VSDDLNELIDRAVELDEVAALEAASPPAEPEEPQGFDVRVKVRWDEANNRLSIAYSDPTDSNLVDKAQVIAKLPEVYAKAARVTSAARRNYYDIKAVITQTRNVIPLQVWSDAIAAAIIQAKLARRQTEAETVLSANNPDGGYMLIGDQLARISLVGAVSANKAMALMRRQATEQARQQARSILEAATAAAATTTLNAEQAAQGLVEAAARQKREAAQYLADIKGARYPDVSLVNSGAELRKQDDKWQVAMEIDYKPQRLVFAKHLNKQWPCVEGPAVKVRLWQPFDVVTGVYNVRDIRVDGLAYEMPHVGYESACMEVGQRPDLLRTAVDLDVLRQGVEHSLNASINLESLLRRYRYWDPRVQNFVPRDLATAIYDTGIAAMAEVLNNLPSGQPLADDPEDSEEVFRI
jgi:hypothetical protein